MKVVYDRAFIRKLKKVNVRIRKKVIEKALIFSKNPHDPQLHNHALKGDKEGYRSINIASDWRILYKEIRIGKEVVAYFLIFGTHKDLYK